MPAFKDYTISEDKNVESNNQWEMAKAKKKGFFLFNIFKSIFKFIWRWTYIILAASMIGFSNAYFDEHRWINDARNFTQQEQVFNDEDK